MENWTGNKTDKNLVNGGQQFEPNDAVVADDINACFNNSFYSVDYATHLADTPDTSQAGSVGTPSVTLVNNVVGGITYKKFKFSNLKGATGAAAGFGTVSATVDANVGTPSVNVSTSGDDTAKNFAFAFHNMKGATGATGLAALEYSSVRNVTTVPKISDTFTLTDSFNRTPVSGDYVNIICRNTNSGETYTLVCRVTSYSNGTATLTIVSLTNTRGAKGDKGDKGDKGITVNDGGSTTYDTVSFTLSGTTLTITTSA